ncbi:DMT family transporter [Aurantimonas sp. VKM B-3413]|uniref:DMT family transporter n=1 Tax=Aurantimonas sp. VKM B-3413 TaxID=2779401 RepID=UPI001E4D7DBF|nr:DMT family transporter [Aurantimonas sp. VKM B-3413]MCB8840454.1 DMT family transporter [Aurantimonas sp. VKM B-3413]
MATITETLENTPAETIRGIVIMASGAAFIPLLDAFGKILVTTYEVPPGEVSLIRLILQAVMILPLLLLRHGIKGLATRHPRTNFLRGALLGIGGIAFFGALKFMPLADAVAVFLVEPMIVTLLSALLLKESVGWRRILAVLAGFVGALIIIRPSYAVFGLASLLPLAAAIAVGLYLILSRRVSRGTTPMGMLFYAGLGGAAVVALLIAVGEALAIPDLSFRWPREAAVWGIFLVMGAVGTAGHLCFIEAYRLAPASLLAPFGYIEIVSAIILGYLFFSELPDAPKFLGIAIIVGSGLFIYLRERRLAVGVERVPAEH